ncbi:Gins 15 protein [Pyrococcus horikoshii]|nr:Gins 15 protein [Pyrococcus horikoshii]HII60820.1 DNA replication complex GINS family protein [Pyrococcus horikoshii]
MDIEVLRRLLERELSSEELTEIDEEFYRDLASFRKALELNAERYEERGEDIEKRLYLAQLSLVQSIAREILKIRLHKIVDMAFEGVPKNLVGDEKKIFAVLSAFINGEPISIETTEVEVKEEKVESKTPSGFLELYLLKSDIPRIIDENLNEYGPFKAGDLVTLPRSIGNVLVKREVAEKITIRI